jgi:septal ring factor EnvC (AmiA/AmiB activator)
MAEEIKGRVILILSIVCLIFLISAVSSCSNAYRNKAARDKEMSMRLDMEEKMGKVVQEKSSSEGKLKKELEEERTALEALKKALTQEELVNQSLKEELQKLTKLKEALEEDLKEAMVQGKGKNK